MTCNENLWFFWKERTNSMLCFIGKQELRSVKPIEHEENHREESSSLSFFDSTPYPTHVW